MGEKALTIEPEALTPDVVAYLAHAARGRTDTTGGTKTMDEVLHGSQAFKVVQEGEVVARFALKRVAHATCTECYVTAAVGQLPGVDLVAAILPHIEARVQGCDVLSVITRRRGLMAKLERMGYERQAVTYRKRL
ncbi:hypothetical protein BGV68_01905 [Burkholderia ubonensis]|uniref:hypothetical protein n=1 Tax=Burkholderia ubonensis TaxID=101571 RepID=UPI0008FE0F31|nr:hypothetical protein [Burkholderia ubonensis]OJA63800.1 hypothetical protein BGV68_01905 [Burkholderia ubonensis]